MCHLHQSHLSVICYIWIEVYHCYVCPLFCEFTWLFSLCRTDCGFHTLEYFAKWEGRLVPAITAATVVELRKIYTWNWLTDENFNKRSGAHEFIEEPVKKVIKKYKWSRGVTHWTHTLHSVAEECKVLSLLFLCQKLCSCARLWRQPRVAYYVVMVCEWHLNRSCNICVDVNIFLGMTADIFYVYHYYYGFIVCSTSLLF